MKTFVKFGVAALAATLAAGSAMAATAPQTKTAPARAHHHVHHHAKAAHLRKHHHAKIVHAKVSHAKVALRAAGRIDRINAKHNTVTINHRVYRLAPSLASQSFKPGQKVQITYTKGRGHRLIEKIAVVSA